MSNVWHSTAVGFLRARLQRTIEEIAALNINLIIETNSVSNQLEDRFSCIGMLGGASALTGRDATYWGEAVGLITTIRLRPLLARNLPTGDVKKVRLGHDEFEFLGSSPTGKPLEQIWLEEALLALGKVTCIRAYYNQAASNFNPFTISGPTRTADNNGVHETLLSGVIRLLTDEWDVDQATGDSDGDDDND